MCKNSERILVSAIACLVLLRAIPASADVILASGASIVQVDDGGDLDLENYVTAVSFRPDLTDDTIPYPGGVSFYAVSMTGSKDPFGTTIIQAHLAVNATQQGGVQPTTSDAHLNWLFNSMVFNTADVTVQTLLPNGTYQVQLALYDGWSTQAGQRLVDISMEGEIVATDFDYFVGQGNTRGNGTLLVQTVDVSDGVLNVTIGQSLSYPQISGLIVTRVIPEPSSLVLLGMGLFGSMIAVRRRK